MENPTPYKFAHESGSTYVRLAHGHICVVLGHPLEPVGPVQTFAPSSDERLSPAFNVIVENLDLLDAKYLSENLGGFGRNHKLYSSYDANQRRAIGAAARRYFKADREPDTLDRYIDYWIVCEFLERKGVWPKGGLLHRVATDLSDYTGINKQAIEKKIRDLYRVRGNLVHNAQKENPDFENNLLLVRVVARSLLRYRYGLDDDGSLQSVIDGVKPDGFGVQVQATIGKKQDDR